MKRARGVVLAAIASQLAVAAAAPEIVSASEPAKAPPLDITESDFAGRVREAVIDRLRVPSVQRWGTGPEVILTPRFAFVRDAALTLPAPPWFGEGAYAAAFELVRSAWYSTQPDRARLLMVFSTFPDGGEALFYLAVANDVAGLGEGLPAQIFDETPDSSLDGFAWLGDVDILESAGDAYFREAFIHEIAHRWSAYARVEHPEVMPDALRGRQSMHWSFFVDSNGSPMEGNDWVQRPNNTWATSFEDPPVFRFSPLDLYFMGVVPPESVAPFFVIDSFAAVLDPPGMNITAETAPAHRSGMRVVLSSVSAVEISIEDVIAGSGERVPAAVEDRVVWPIGIVLLSNGLEKTKIEELVRLDQRIAELARDFERATGGRVTLDVRVAGAGEIEFGAPCAEVAECNRTRSDRCAPIRSGGEPVCTRTCADDLDCGPGFCCGVLAEGDPPSTASGGEIAVCLAGSRCVQPSPIDPGMGGKDKPKPGPEMPGPGGPLEGGEMKVGCACSVAGATETTATTATSERLGSTPALAALGALVLLARSRKRSLRARVRI